MQVLRAASLLTTDSLSACLCSAPSRLNVPADLCAVLCLALCTCSAPPCNSAPLPHFCRYESYANLIRITFSEAPPLTGERYGLNVWSQPYLTEAPQQLGDWTNLQWGANDNGAGKKEMLINTVAGDGYSSWLQPGEQGPSRLCAFVSGSSREM